MRTTSASILLAIAFILAFPVTSARAQAQEKSSGVIAIKAKRILPGAGDAIENGVIIIRDRKIAAMGVDLAIPEGARVFDRPECVVTPGLIDACCIVDSEVWQNTFYFMSETDCPQCADLHRRHITAVNGGALLKARGSETAPQAWASCELCAATHSQHGRNCPVHGKGADKRGIWERVRTAAEQQKNAEETHAHDEAEGACGCICAGSRSAAQDAQPFAAVLEGVRSSWAEHASEVVPHTNVIDSVNLLSHDFERLLRSGVTTVFVSPDTASVIGARGAIVRTGGPLDQRVVRAAGAVKAAMGRDPVYRGRANFLPRGGYADLHTRRPTTRMGVDFNFRKAFYDTQRWSAGIACSGSDTPPEAAFPVLREILDAKIPLRVNARMLHDIISALRLAHEFGLKITLDEATESYKCLAELRATQTPVIFGPLFIDPRGHRAQIDEADDARLSTPRQLLDAGIPFALTAQEMRDEEGLIRQAMMARRYGLPADVALRAVTSSAARLLDLGEEAGVLKPGAAADLVIWSGDPLDAATRVRTVIVGGAVAVE